mmetsp:Transcript_8564/g.15547  ORF Transcript_8564/g.15547 Transcript_8564/m.15547 type:complete len:146 (+) Transcript_8564:146-583(+)
MKPKRGFVCLLLSAGRGYGAVPPSSSQHCQENGGMEAAHYSADGGQYVLCIFDDGTACDTWEFYGGACNKGSVPVFSGFCDESGGQLSHRSVNWGDVVGAEPAEYDACTFENGSECDEYFYYYLGGCMTYQVKVFGDEDVVSEVT